MLNIEHINRITNHGIPTFSIDRPIKFITEYDDWIAQERKRERTWRKSKVCLGWQIYLGWGQGILHLAVGV